MNANDNASTRRDCHLLTISVRVNGPEIFAGVAEAVQPNAGTGTGTGTGCYWEYSFDLQVEGSYSADAKVIMWNGAAPVGGTDESQCQVRSGNITQVDGFPVHVGFVGFKIYHPTQSCCEGNCFFHRKLLQVDFTIAQGARVVWHVETIRL
jgi:hypothetical protein